MRRLLVIIWLNRRAMHQPITTEPVDPEPDTTLAAHYEAECRKRMAQIAATPDRGFDTRRERDRLIRKLDGYLDAYNRIAKADG